MWGLSLAAGLTDAAREPGEPVGAVTVDGVEHVVERVTDPARIAAIREHVGRDDVLIADGHHRYAISRTYRDEVRAATGRATPPAELTLAFVGELVAEQLSIEADPPAVHRRRRRRSCAPQLRRSFDVCAGRRARRRRRWPTMEADGPARARRPGRRRRSG